MQERIRHFIELLERNAADQDAISGLEDVVTGDDSAERGGEILSELKDGRARLIHLGRFEAACRIIELEEVICDKSQEVELLLEKARIYDEELFDQKTALSIFEKVVSITEDQLLKDKIAAIKAERSKWEEIVVKFVEQAEGTDEPSLKTHMLYSAAERTYKNHKRGKDIPSLLNSALETDPANLRAARLLEKVLKERERWGDLAELYAKLAEHRQSKDEKAQMLMAAAHTYDTRIEDKESAALYYGEVLDLMPGNDSAMRFLAGYYEEQEDWEHLVALYEDALSARPSKDEEAAMLMQVGMIHWRMRSDLDKAEEYFRKLRKIDAAHQGMIRFYKAHTEQTGNKTRLIQILTDAQRVTKDKKFYDQLNKDIAQCSDAEGGNVERAIDAWKAVLRKEPDNSEARGKLKKLYWDTEKWNALLDLLRSEAETFPDEDSASKVAIYEEVVKIYRDHLGLGAMVINTYKTIIELDPANESAMEALSEAYEKEGRWNDLVNMLNSRVSTATDSSQKVALLNKVATLWIERFNNFNRAVDPLEEILKEDPTDANAIATLKNVYQKRRAWRPLIELLEKEVESLEGDEKRDRLAEMAQLAAERLSDHAKAIALWRQVLDFDPDNTDAIGALEKLTERTKDWEGLCEVLEKRVTKIEDVEEKVGVLTKLGTVLKDRLKDPSRAASAWKRVLEVKPDHSKSMRSLREAYLASQDWEALEELYSDVNDYEGLVEQFGIAADRINDIETKKMLSFRCAELYVDPIGQPDRAERHYQRVISVDGENERAARELAPIYRRGEKWKHLVDMQGVILKHTKDVEERVLLMDDLRELCATKMNNRSMAYDWAARAYQEMPGDESVVDALETAAENGGKFEDLAILYTEQLDNLEGKERTVLERHIAEIMLERLGAVDDAVAGYRAILEKNPDDDSALSALENIFRTTARWDDLVGIFETRIEQTTDDTRKRDLIFEMAKLLEDGMDNSEKAAVCYRNVLEIFSDDREALLALERIAKLSEKWDELTGILEKLRTLADTTDEDWRDMTSRYGLILDEKIGDKPRAIEVYSEILERHPGNEETISAMEHFLRDQDHQEQVAKALEPHLMKAQNWRLLAWALTIILEGTEDPEERLALHVRLSDVYFDKLDDHRVTFETLGVALKEHPDNKDLWDRLELMAPDLDLMDDLANRFEEAYDSDKVDDSDKVELASRLSDILDNQLGRSGDAAKYYLHVFKSDPSVSNAFKSLEHFYTSEEQWNDLLDLYDAAMEGNTDVYTPLELRLKVCFILHEVNQDVPAAIESYRAVLDLDPGNTEAVRALTGLYEEAERWEDLSNLLSSQLDQATGEEAVEMRYRLGEIAEHRLRLPVDALDHYELVLTEDPDHLKAQGALERLIEIKDLRLRVAKILEQTYDHQGAAEPLARVLTVELEDVDLDIDTQVQILSRIADLHERRLGDPDGAFGALSKAFDKDPANEDVFVELGRVAGENAFEAQYAKVLDDVIPNVIDDVMLASKLMIEVADLYDVKLGEMAKAEGAYRRLLDLDQGNPDTAIPAIEALERILASHESWEQLLDVLRIKTRLLDDPSEQKDVLHRMAELEESVIERIPNAIAIFNEIVDLDETDMTAMFGLERLYERLEAWQELVNTLRRRANMENSPEVRRDLFYRVATLIEQRIEDLDEAIAAYCQVNDEVGSDSQALEALARLYQSTGAWRDLYETYEAQEQMAGEEDRLSLLFAMGDLLRTKLDEPEQAVEKLGDALKLDSSHEQARASLEAMLDSSSKVEVIRILSPIYEAEGNYEQLLKCAQLEAQDADDPMDRSQIYRRAAEIAEVGLEQMDRAYEFMGLAFRDGTASPDLERLIDEMERLAKNVDGYKTLTELYREVGPDILDGDLQIRCSLRVAEIAHTILQDSDLARDYYVRVLDIDGENSQAMDALEEIYEASEQHLELFEIYRRKVQCAFDESLRREILFKQARVCEVNLDDLSGATSTYETILESDPANMEAMDALERLYQKADRWADLMDLLERRAELDEAERADLLHRLGTLAEEQMGDDERSLDYFSRVLEIDHVHEKTISSLEASMEDEGRRGRVAEILEPVYKDAGDWAKLAVALNARLDVCDDPMERKEFIRQIGRLYEDQMGDLEKAFDTYARLFGEDIEDKTSWDILSRLAAVLENWDKLAIVYGEALEDVVGDTPVTAELAFILGQIYEERLEMQEEATVAYRRTLGFAPDDENAFSAVERMLLATESWDDLLDLYREAAEAALDMDRRKEFIFKVAEIQEASKSDLDAAIDAYRDIIDIDDRETRAITSLDRLFYQAQRYEDLTIHLRSQIDQGDDPQGRNALRMRLGAVYEENQDDLTSAVDAYEEALQEEGGGIIEPLNALVRIISEVEEQRERIADILEPIYRETDEWKQLVVILKTQVQFIDNPADKAAKFKEIAELHKTRGNNFLLAFNSMAKAFHAEPSDRELLAEMVRIAEGIENWDELVTVLADVIEDIYDIDFKVEVLHLQGNIYDRHLDMPRKAIGAFKEILEINDSDMKALEALDGLFNLVGDWDGLVEVLALKANFVSDPEERAAVLRNKASIHEDLMSQPEEAIDSYRQALEADATSEITMEALERLFEAAKEWVDLIEVKQQHAEVVVDQAARIEILRSIGRIYEEHIDDAFEAISSWRAVLEQDDRDNDAIAALDRLFTKESMFNELLDNLKLQKETTGDQAMWVDISIRIGDLQEKEMSDLEGAIESYRDVLAQQPTHAQAIESLERLAKDESVRMSAIEVLEPLHRESTRWDRLADILELKLEVIDEPADKLNELLALAELHESGRSVPKAAFDVYARALVEDPARTQTMESLERLAEAERLWDKLAEVYEKQADDVYDAQVESALLQRLGEVRETRMADTKGAIDAYRRALDSGSTEQGVLQSLDRLYEIESMWTELDEILEREIDMADSGDEINRFKIRQGIIREQRFDDVAGAINAFRDVVEASPDNEEASTALEALLKKDEFVEDIVEVLTPVYEIRDEKYKISELFVHRLRVADVDSEKVSLYRDLAIHQENLGDLSAAFDAYSKAFVLDPADSSLLDELEKLAEGLGAWAALVETVEGILDSSALDSSEAVDMGLKVATWASTNVGDPSKAESLYRTVLEKESEHQGALTALEDLLRELGRFEDLLPVMKQRADAIYDYEAKKEQFMAMAQIARLELGNAEQATQAYLAVRELDESDLDSLDALISLVEDSDKYDKLVEWLMARAEYTTDMIEGNRFRHRAATVYIGPLSDTANAVDVYRQIMENDPSDKDASAQLEALYEQGERWNDLQDLMMTRLDSCADDSERVVVLEHLATICETRFDEPEDAIGHLVEITMIDSDNAGAIEGLERLYTKTERWQDLVELLEGCADRARDNGDGEGELRQLVRVGKIWDERLEDPDQATSIYERVLESDSNHTGALAALARLYEAAEDWDRCAEVLERAVATGGGGADQAEVHFRLARMKEGHMGDESGALEELRKAIACDPGHLESNHALAEHCKKSGDNEGLLEALMREEMHMSDGPDKVTKLLEIADIQAGPLNDKSGSVASLERARELGGSNKELLLKLSDAYIEDGRQDDAIPVIESLIDAETDGGKRRSKKAAVYHEKLAKAYRSKDVNKALEHLEAAYKLDISNVAVLVSLGKLHYELEDYDKAVKLFRALLLQRFNADVGISKADVYWYVGDISLKQGDTRKAKGMFQRGLDEDKTHEGCKTGLAQC